MAADGSMRGATRAGHRSASWLTREEWGALYVRVRRVLCARMRGARPCDIDDAVHDVMAAIAAGGPHVYRRDLGEPIPFFTEWARTRGTRAMKRARGNEALSCEDEAIDDTDAAPSPEWRALAGELKLAVEDAPLERYERRAFVLWLDGWRETEIASAVGVNKSQISRAVRMAIVWTCRMRGIAPPRDESRPRERAAPVPNIDPRQAGFSFCDDVDLSICGVAR